MKHKIQQNVSCSSNNRSSTVYDLFIEAVRFSLPSRVRSEEVGQKTMQLLFQKIGSDWSKLSNVLLA